MTLLIKAKLCSKISHDNHYSTWEVPINLLLEAALDCKKEKTVLKNTT